MGNSVIEVENLGEFYRGGQLVGCKALKESVASTVYMPLHHLGLMGHRQQAISCDTKYIRPPKACSGKPSK